MANNNFAAKIVSRAADHLDRAALVLPDADGTIWTFADVVDRSARYARGLRSLGVKPGDRVAVQVDKSPEALCLYLGCLRMGGVFLPLNTAYTVHELAYFFEDSCPALVVCRPEMANEVEKLCKGAGIAACETLDADGRGSLGDIVDIIHDVGVVDEPRGADDVAALLYTSGTTGRSKGAMITHANLSSNALALGDAWKVRPGDVLIHALPIFHIHGLFVAANVSLLAGSSMLFLLKFDPIQVAELLPAATIMMGVPTFYTRLLDHRALNRDLCAGLRMFVSGSAPLPPDTHRAWLERTGHAIIERYGMTETGINTSNPIEGARLAGSVGPALRDVTLRVTCPETGVPLSAHEVGMIEVRGPNVFKGYWNMAEKTAASFTPDHYFKTGDLGCIDDDGYVHIVGRDKDLIITGGYNVYPKEIEIEIDALDGVVESAVIGIPHPDLGEGVAAVVVKRAKSELSEDQIMAQIGGRLARFKLPKIIIFEDELPRNAMGKVQKNQLREKNRNVFGR